MTLDEYMKREDAPSAKDLADRIKLSEASISRLRRGDQKPSVAAMKEIYVATGGMVTPNDFVGIAA